MSQEAQKAHATSLHDIVRCVETGLKRLPVSQEQFKAQKAAAVLAIALEELIGASASSWNDRP